MRWFTRCKSLVGSERASVAATVAVAITALLGMTGAAVDLGMIYAARSELQNAADSAALAGANTLIAYNGDNLAIAQPSVATANAQSFTEANTTLNAPLIMLSDDLTMGFWDAQTGDFDYSRVGPSLDPDDLTALRVKLRRDDSANSPVNTWFAQAVGIDQVPLSVRSTAHLGYAGSTKAGQVDLPIAIIDTAIKDGDGPTCGDVIQFTNESDETAEWTTFFTWPSSDPSVRQYIKGELEIPPLEVGQEINVNNGKISQHAFQDLMSRFQNEGADLDGDGNADEWKVLLPVTNEGGPSATSTVVGFCNFVITAVTDAPEKRIDGWLECGKVVPDSQTGGDDFGSRANYAKLVN